MSFFSHLYCADCGCSDIISNGDNDCCAECGGHNYEEYEEEADEPIDSSKQLSDMFGSWVPIFGSKP